MKILIFFFACLAAVSCTTDYGTPKDEFTIRQRNLIRLFLHVHSPNVYHEQVTIGRTFNFLTYLKKFTNEKAVKEFYTFYKHGALPKNTPFVITNDRHRHEAIALFHVFYFAQDFETFYKTACWAREFMNEGLFIYSFTVAVRHRADCKGFYLPPPYEVYPFYFFNKEVIETGKNLKIHGKFENTDVRQFYNVHQTDNTFIIKSNYSGWYVQKNHEQKLTYFMEDIGLNTYYFYFHVDNPFWMGGHKYGLNEMRRGEYFYFFHQQFLARFYMERLSNGFGEIPNFFFNQPIKTGYESNLKYFNGLDFPSRPNFYNLQTEDNLFKLQDFQDCDRFIRDTVQRGFFFGENGGVVKLDTPESINEFGNFVQRNPDTKFSRFFYSCELVGRRLLGAGKPTTSVYTSFSGALEHFETAVRDPMFYQFYKRFMHHFYVFKNFLKPYTYEELSFTGVSVEHVTVSKLFTFFDHFDSNINNAFVRTHDEVTKQHDNYGFFVRQHRLNHGKFDVTVDVKSDKTTDVFVRMFIGPKYDHTGHKIDFNENRLNFFLVDAFDYKLQTGQNFITRKSDEFTTTTADFFSTSFLLDHTETEFPKNTQFYNRFPDRLVLPKGHTDGMTFQFFVIISPQETFTYPTTTKYTKETFFEPKFFMDNKPFGYPFDRRITTYKDFFTTNMFMTDVVIFHDDTYNVDRTTYNINNFFDKSHNFVKTKYDDFNTETTGFVASHDNFNRYTNKNTNTGFVYEHTHY